LKLFTSIPPRFSRKHSQTGEETGPHYLERCVNSWRANGFDPVSINRPEEAGTIRASGLIDVIEASQQDALVPDRYGPSLGSIFDAAPRNAPFAIVNADIYMRPGAAGTDLAHDIAGRTRKTVLVSRRTDVAHLDALQGTVYACGIDFVALDPSRIPEVIKDADLRRFQLGVPWWDYVLPLAALKHMPAKRIEEPFILHQTHDERWNPEIYTSVVPQAYRVLQRYDAQVAAVSPTSKRFAADLSRVCHETLLFDPGLPVTTLPLEKSSLRVEVHEPKRKHKAKIVRELSRVINQCINLQRRLMKRISLHSFAIIPLFVFLV